MTFRYIADTYAWFSFFSNQRFKDIIENNLIETPTIVIGELVKTFKNRKIPEEEIEKAIAFVESRGFIIPLNMEIAKKGGAICVEEKLPFVDAIIYAHCDSDECRLLTGDEHFRGKKNIVFEKE